MNGSKHRIVLKTGSFADAISMATSVKDKAVKIMESLGMSVSAPTPAAVPAAPIIIINH